MSLCLLVISLVIVPTNATPNIVTGTQKVEIIGDDWGPAVTKSIITLDQEVDASSIQKDDFKVKEIKIGFDWSSFRYVLFEADRTVLDVYLSDSQGNKVDSATGSILTIEMYVSPSDGSPFMYDIYVGGLNTWCTTYELDITLANDATLSSGGILVDTFDITAAIDLTDANNRIHLIADDFAINSFTDSNGVSYSYGEYVPTSTSSKKKPLVIWLHGAGEGGSDNYIDLLGSEVTALASQEFQSLFRGGAYILTPQSPTVWMDDGEGNYQEGDLGSCYKDGLMELIEAYVAQNPNIDTNQIIIGGCSNGGYMTMEMILAYPEYFAAAYPICEAFLDKFITDEQLQAVIDNEVGIWFTHAMNDRTIGPQSTSVATYNRLIDLGATNVYFSSFEKVVDTTGRFTDANGNAYEYNGHYSWIYFFNNECVADSDASLTCWQWLAAQTKAEDVVVTGTQKVEIIGEDWGPAVTKTIITLDQEVDASSIQKDDFKVKEIKNGIDWSTYQYALLESPRNVLAVYLSDSQGNRTDSQTGNILTIEMYVSPNEGSPFIYDVVDGGLNKWCTTYQLHITLANDATLSSVGEYVDLFDITATIDVTDVNNRICLVADDFNFNTFTDSEGVTYTYGEYVPTSSTTEKKPLVIWLHGAGEGGSDNYIDLLGNEVTALASQEFQSLFSGGAYILTPQSPTMWMDDGTGHYQSGDIGSCYREGLMELIEAYVAGNPNIDTNRIIIGGCSNGGYMTLDMMLTYPDYFAAGYPICEAFSDEFITDAQLQALVDNEVGIWFIHAMNDTAVIPQTTSIATYNRLIALGATNVYYSTFETVVDTTGRFDDIDGNAYQYYGHWSWTYFFNNECVADSDASVTCWQWLASQVKSVTTNPDNDQDNDQTIQTGDTITIGLFVATTILSLLIAIYVFYRKKKEVTSINVEDTQKMNRYKN